ncbi:MAG: UTP--glucose-1-phosphate uridylyltransferase [Candidatus Babeliales bacterium]
MEITKTIIPAAGLGTRFLPITKAIPKEMLPILNKPAIHYIIEEALQSEVNQCIFITSKDKEAIADYFDTDAKLDDILQERHKENLLAGLNKIMRTAHFTYIRQSEPLGLGHAVSLARYCITPKEYFGVMLPDDIIIGQQPGLAQLIRIAHQEKASVIAVQEVPDECVSSYGVIAIKKQITPNLFQVSQLVEKPAKKDAPSNLAIIGRYVLSAKIFKALDEINAYSTTNELQLTDGISHMMHQNEKVFAYKIQGTRYDVGNPVGWIKAVIGIGLQNPQYAPHIKDFLANLNTPSSFVYDTSKNIRHASL